MTFWVHKSESSAVLFRRLRKIITMIFCSADFEFGLRVHKFNIMTVPLEGDILYDD